MSLPKLPLPDILSLAATQSQTNQNMASIHQALNEGSVVALNNVKVTRVFPMKPGDKSLFLFIEDSSSKSALKIWGPASHCGVQEGQTISISASGPKGRIEKKEWNGKVSIDCNDCKVSIQGGGSYEAVQPAPPQEGRYASPAPTGGGYAATPSSPTGGVNAGDLLPATMKRAALATHLYVDELVVNHGFTRDEACMLAQGAGGWFPIWWFGEKGLNR